MPTLSDMPWFGRPADPVGAIVSGVQIGSTIANLRERRMQAERDTERLQMERQQFPLDLEAKEIVNESNRITLDQFKRGVRMQRESLSAKSRVLSMIDNSILSGNAASDTQLSQIMEEVQRFPILSNDPEIRKAMDLYNESRKIALDRLRLTTEASIDLYKATKPESTFTPTTGTLQHPVTGEPIPFITTSEGSIKTLPEEEPSLTPAMRESKAITELENKIDATTDPVLKTKLQRELTNLKQQTIPSGLGIEFDEQGKVRYIGKGGARNAGGQTQSRITALQERLNQNRSGVLALTEIQRQTRSTDVGPLGVLGETLFDKVLPAFGITLMADPRRISTRELIKVTGEELMRVISGDQRFNVEDRKAVKKALPSTGFIESEKNVKESAEVIKQILSKRALLDSIDLNQPLPNWAVNTFSDYGFASMLRDDVISQNDLMRFVRENQIDAPRAKRINDIFGKFGKR